MLPARKRLVELISKSQNTRFESVVSSGLILVGRFADSKEVVAALWNPDAMGWADFRAGFFSEAASATGSQPSVLKLIGGSKSLQDVPNDEVKIEKVEKHFPLRLVVLPAEGRVLIAPEPVTEAPELTLRPKKERVRVYIVDDSQVVRLAVRRLLSSDSRIVVVGESGDPVAAIEEIVRLRPDVITLDIHMPKLNGVEVLERLKTRYPVPALILSSLSKEEGSLVMQALSAGAIDFVKKPTADNVEDVAKGLREKVFVAGQAAAVEEGLTTRTTGNWDLDSLIVIGASTGGTRAIETFLKILPPSIPPILIVQHIPPVFSKAFADRLNELVPFSVREAKSGERVLPNQVLVAPGGKQMRVRKGPSQLEIELTDDPPVNGFSPSVDYLFDSVAKLPRLPTTIAVLMTGMGKDGARGLLNLKECKVRTIAQDEATCVVYGMPGTAVRLGAAEFIEPLGEIPARIENIFQKNSLRR